LGEEQPESMAARQKAQQKTVQKSNEEKNERRMNIEQSNA
jgi:hypothetical protein